MTNPYSYVTQGGVANTRVRVSEDEATLEQLRAEFKKPVVIHTTVDEYHAGTKRERGATKKVLPYFVGGTLHPNKRDDANVQRRTLLTLDIEQGEHNVTPPPSPESVADRLDKLGGAGWIYTSLSHTEDAPRFRVVLPLGKPIEGSVEDMQGALEATTRAAAEKLGIGEWCQPESWTLSQAMYLPAKLVGGTFYEAYSPGRAWQPRRASGVSGNLRKDADEGVGTASHPKDIPDHVGQSAKADTVLDALKSAGLYLGAKRGHAGMHFIKCPCLDQHGDENDTQTVYYEANFDGNPRAAVKCFDTAPDTDGEYHLTYKKLVHFLKEEGHLSQEQQSAAGVLDDYSAFMVKADLGRMLDSQPVPREWAIPKFAPVGKVTVLGGPGGVSKSMLLLHVLVHGAMGQSFGEFSFDAPLRSLYVSYEDDQQELHSRIHALTGALAAQDDGVFGIINDVQGAVRKNLHVYAADEEALAWVLAAKEDRFGVAERTERVDWLIGLIKHANIRCLVLDPAVYTHQLEENNIADMAAFMQMLTYIAKQGNCAVIILHHMSKASSWTQLGEVNQGGLRGASSFADNARSVTVALSMPVKDAVAYGLPADRTTTSRYVVTQHVKHNYSAPMPQQVFERKGPLLIPRPDIVPLDQGQLTVARQVEKESAAEAAMLVGVDKVLEFLLDMSDFASMSQISLGAKVHKRGIGDILDYCEANDYLEVEEGPKHSRLSRLTKDGKAYIKLKMRHAK